MKKNILIGLCLLGTVLTASAQLEVSSDGKVKIASNVNTSYSTLLVGNNTFNVTAANIGILGSTDAMNSKKNIGVFGTIDADSSLSNDNNFGVLGIVSPINNTHGRNYGLGGMVGYSGDHYGGTGVYGASSAVYYAHPTNIQGTYAGYFKGPVRITGELTAPNMYIPTDSRLSENVESLNERGGKTCTLDNLLAMNVIEYNMKSRISDELPESIEKDATDKEREAYECLKRDEMKICARRHFGIDAEELQKVYPDLVLEGQDGYLSVNYVELVPLLIRSIQELKAELDELKGKDGDAVGAGPVPARSEASARQASDIAGNVASKATLYQNTPNPFTAQTEIRFSLPDDALQAYIYIFDMTGKMQKQIPVDPSQQSVTINGYELSAGIYLYSLVVGGQEIDTKRMILSK